MGRQFEDEVFSLRRALLMLETPVSRPPRESLTCIFFLPFVFDLINGTEERHTPHGGSDK